MKENTSLLSTTGRLKSPPTENQRLKSTRSPITPEDGVEVALVKLGEIGRAGNAETEKINRDIAALIVKLEPFLEAGQLKPLEYVKVGDVGVAEILKGIEAFTTHKSGKKLIVKVAEE